MNIEQVKILLRQLRNLCECRPACYKKDIKNLILIIERMSSDTDSITKNIIISEIEDVDNILKTQIDKLIEYYLNKKEQMTSDIIDDLEVVTNVKDELNSIKRSLTLNIIKANIVEKLNTK